MFGSRGAVSERLTLVMLTASTTAAAASPSFAVHSRLCSRLSSANDDDDDEEILAVDRRRRNMLACTSHTQFHLLSRLFSWIPNFLPSFLLSFPSLPPPDSRRSARMEGRSRLMEARESCFLRLQQRSIGRRGRAERKNKMPSLFFALHSPHSFFFPRSLSDVQA